jgi:Amt family ammonium transporter
MACNGALAGLVGITAPVAYVSPLAAVIIGAIAAPIMMVSIHVIENVFKIDDPVGAISVHGTTGLWGILAVGIFANGTNDVTGLWAGNYLQIVSQLINAGVVLFLVLKAGMGVRATREEELEGLDMPEHGIEAYPEEITPEEIAPQGVAGD